MKSVFFFVPRSVLALACLTVGIAAQAATVTGTVSNKTTGKPSAGDSVVLVDVGAGMSEAATATTDAKGHYSLQSPGTGAYLVRVNHQGANYFIGAPQGDAPGDVTVYDVAAKVDGVSIDADMLLVEGASGVLRVQERYLIRNTSLPPKAQFSNNTFEIALPADAELDGASATRPGGMSTNTRLVPIGAKGHYTFNIPIQPDKGEKETMFEVQYHLPYKGKYTFTQHVPMPADNLVIYVPKGMTFSAGQGADFGPVQEDPRVQTYIHKNVKPGDAVSFTVSGEGSMPRDQQQQRPVMGAGGTMAGSGAETTPAAGGPGRRYRRSHQHARSADSLQMVDPRDSGVVAGGGSHRAATQANPRLCALARTRQARRDRRRAVATRCRGARGTRASRVCFLEHGAIANQDVSNTIR